MTYDKRDNFVIYSVAYSFIGLFILYYIADKK